ncbi:hypothetical protein NI17_008260 [Thermobifida halotolerans]|uniref:Uncharacterized protein n=1 Tax=Thermobifida halotolerans TaxID=483545 RepID=A0A399G4Y3_9ACTN|nr:DUF6052 family protein [Thermobifida halotolerans]UOE21123.1 hypothetical protein NI17_008260 [Thermobifida halotolerans]
MTNGRAELSAEEKRRLRECYDVLQEFAGTGPVPSVRAAARVAVAELHAVLDGQAMDFDFYSHRWLEDGTGDDGSAGTGPGRPQEDGVAG